MSQARQFVLVRFFFNFQNPHDRLEIRERTREGVSFSPMKTILIFFFLLHTRLKFLNITININLHCVWHSDISTTGFFSFSLFICSLYVRVIYFIFKLILLSSFFCIFFFNCLLIENFTRQFFTDQRLASSFFFFFSFFCSRRLLMFIQMLTESWAIGFLMADATRIYSHTLDNSFTFTSLLVLNDNAIRFFRSRWFPIRDPMTIDLCTLLERCPWFWYLLGFRLLLLSVSFAFCFFLFNAFIILSFFFSFRFRSLSWLQNSFSVSKIIQDSRELFVKISAEI